MMRQQFCRLALIVFYASTYQALGVEVVRNHAPAAVIVIDKSASSQVRAAASTLQDYIQKSTGAKLPIVNIPQSGVAINVGHTAYLAKHQISSESLDKDGFVLEARNDNNIVIIGGSDWGTEFGVYEFLERYVGVRWLMPTELGTDIPAAASLNVPVSSVRQEPTYLSRQLSPVDITAHTALGEWGRFNRARGRIAFHHNLLHLFQPSKFATTHPDLYPIVDGTRYIPSNDQDPRWQPNLSMSDSVSIAVQQIDGFFQTHPDANSYSLGMNDSNNWDQSISSRQRRSGRKNYLGLEDVSDDYFTWANAVAKAVLMRYPDKYFGTLAYHGLAEPPTNALINQHIIPFITYDRMQWANIALRNAGQQLNARWERAAPVLGWYDYAYGMSYLVPRVYFHTMQQYLSWGAAHHVRHYYAELYPNWGEGPKPWVLTKLLWNPNQDVDGLLNDWYQHFAGSAAAPELRAFYSLWENFWTKEIADSKFGDQKEYLPFGTDPSYLADVTADELAQADHLMTKSLQLADTPQRKARVERLQQMWNFYKASIIVYQDSHAAHSEGYTSDAKQLVDSAESAEQASQTRQQLMKNFAQEPLFSATASNIARYPATAGDTWSRSAFLNLVPAAMKDPAIRARLARSSVAYIRQQATLLGKMEEGKKRDSVAENPSFEEGMKGWTIWDKASEAPQFHKGSFNVTTEVSKDGQHSLSVSDLSRGSVMQTIPYRAGNYYITASGYIPAHSIMGTATITLQIIDAKGKIQSSVKGLPIDKLALKKEEWTTATIPFQLPANSQFSKLRLLVTLDGFSPNGRIYLDELDIYRIGD